MNNSKITNEERRLNKALDQTSFLPTAKTEIKKTIMSGNWLIKRMTVKELKNIAIMLNNHWHNAVTWKETEIDNDGCFYSKSKEKLIEWT